MTENNILGTESVRWDLADFYKSPDDPAIDADVDRLIELVKEFDASYRGQLKTKLGDAIAAYRAIDELSNQIFVYLRLKQALDVTDQKFKARQSAVSQKLTPEMAEHLTFLEHEIIALEDADIARQANHLEVAKHRSWIADIRRFKTHILPEPIEEALAKRGDFGPGAWAEFFDEVEADLRFEFDGRQLTVEEAMHELGENRDPAHRADLLKVINRVMGERLVKYSAQTLWMIAGSKAVEDRERKYPNPMSARNLGNKVDDAVVDALHRAVVEVGGPICRDWYRLKGEMLGVEKMRWSDRNAKLPFESRRVIPYGEAQRIVIDSYRSFSPTLAQMFEGLVAAHRVDAHVVPGHESGAFNLSASLPVGRPGSWVFLNYLGSTRDVMTLSHEGGHAVHGLLAGEAQGALMQGAPTAYAETASVFGEMTTYQYLLAQIGDDPRERLALVAGKIDDAMNTAVRQTSFSRFEQEVHGAKRRLSPAELDAIWLKVTAELYGADGEVFAYRDMEHLWSYIPHFHRPFYVYGYAFGELLTQSLYAVKDTVPDFEAKYLDLLRAGGTKDAVALLAPFGLDPRNPEFWANGLRVSLAEKVTEARRLWDVVKKQK